MKEPQKPYPPYEWEYRERIEKKYIYSFFESLNEDEDYYEKEDEDEFEERTVEKPLKDVSEVDLAWLVSQVPEGVSLNQIKIEFGFKTTSMSFEDHYVRFYYEVTVPAKTAEFELASEKYRRDLAQYQKDLEVYKESRRQQKIKEAEETLAKLKKGEV